MLTQPFGEEERSFLLTIKTWRAVEQNTGLALQTIAQQLGPMIELLRADLSKTPGGLAGAIIAGRLGSATLDHVREPILQGLIGGGMTPTEAGVLVRKVFDEQIPVGGRPFLEFAPLAFEILMQALFGWADDLGETTPASQ